MKLLFVVNDYSFFVTHRLPIANTCIDRGWDVHVATPQMDEAAEQARREGLTWHGLAMDPGSLNPVTDLRSVWDLARLYKTVGPDLVHHVTVKAVLHGSMAARMAGVPAVVNALSGLGYLYINHNLRNRVIRPVVNTLFRLGFNHPNSRLILQNEDDRQMVLDYKLLDREAITIIRGSGVNTQKFDYLPETNDDVTVVLPARMLWDKGVGEFVAAAQKLNREGIDATFHLLGDTDPKNPKSIPRERLREWDSEEGLFYEGYQEDMVTALEESSIVCLPSYREGLPKALLEAASVGRPIVTTDAPGCREVVDDGENGYLVPVKDSNMLAERIKTLVNDPGLRKRFGEKGRQKVEESLSVDHVVDKTLALYQALLESAETGSATAKEPAAE
ncbi:glycosyltransferase family 4 protein [Halalkalibaculum sp. DA384]|uniref:glycosyltransferase family 4 protein n=1 Tax=Halalkalibaculum sp. DA384 TaxID=3373606 RepID=UPI0037541112